MFRKIQGSFEAYIVGMWTPHLLNKRMPEQKIVSTMR